MATGSVQPSPSPQYTSPPITIILTVILLAFFFVGFFSIYFCRCFMHNLLYAWHLRNSPNSTPVGGATALPARGLDPSIVQSFPTFNYSHVKDYRKEKYGLECAICLVEFEDIDVLRLLTPCCHVFHQECIDLWLESHKTCPVCRRNLDSPVQSPVKCPTYTNNIMHDINENEEMGDSFSITIKDDENEDERRDSDKGERVASSASGRDDQEERNVEKFSRSNSTGHSIVLRNNEGEDRFTLRLPEHVKSNIIKGHNSSRSWTTFGEYKTKNNYYANIGLKEVSGSSGRDNNNKV